MNKQALIAPWRLGAITSTLLCFGLAGQAQAQVNYAKAAQSLGVYYPNRGEFYLQDSDGSGAIKRVSITGTFSSATAQPLAGRWTASGTFAGVGLYDRSTSYFYLKNNTTTSGSADSIVWFGWASTNLCPVAGDWTGKGYDSIGFYDPSSATFYLKNTNTGGSADLTLPVRTDSGAMPPSDAIPIVGDWSGNGICRVGFYSASQGAYYLRLTNDPNQQNCSSNGYGFGGSGQAAIGLMGKWLATSTTSTQALFYPGNSYFVGKYTLNVPPGYGDFSFVAPPQGRELATPVMPVIGKWQPSQSLSAGQNTSPSSPAWLRDQIIYELRIDTFTDAASSGTNAETFKGATGLLPQLADLGVTGVIICPVEANGQGGDIRTNNYYGNYKPGTLEPRLGTDADFTAFVTLAHSLGIMVFVDIVQHGIATNSPYASGTGAFPYDYLSRNANGTILVNYWGCDELDWTSQGLRDWWTNNIGIAWVNKYGLDGFRMDLEPAPGSYPLWNQFKSQVLASTGKQLVLIPELSCGPRAYTYDTTQNDCMISSSGTVINNATGATGNLVDLVKGFSENFYTCGLSNHDSQVYGAQGKLSRFGYGMLLSPFIPRWFMGEEFNATPDFVLSGTGNPLYFSQLHWSQNTGANNTLYKQVKQLIQIRKAYANIVEPGGGPLSNTNIAKVTTYSGVDLPPYTMWSGSNSITVLASNNSATGTAMAVAPVDSMGMSSIPYFQATNLMSGTSLASGSISMVTRSQVLSGLSYPISQGSVIPLLLEGQSLIMQDSFGYTTSNISGHAPASGTGTWSVFYDAGCNISTNGTRALISTGSTGRAAADYAFVPQPNTVYTLNATVNFTGPVGSQGCWQGVGFSNSADDGNHSNNPAPWILIWGQTTGTTNAGTSAFCGSVAMWNGNVPAAYFSGPIQVTVKWDTSTNQGRYYVNGILQTTWTTLPPVSGQTFYAWFQGATTRNYVNVQNVILTSAASPITTMARDNFTYTTSNLNGHAPDYGSGTWSTNYSGVTNISTSGSQALISVNNGVPGAYTAVANLPIALTASNTLYTVSAALNFTGTTSSDCWLGFGYSTVTGGPNQGGNIQGPWMLVRPQSSTGANGGSTGFYGAASGHTVGNWTVPAAQYPNVTISITYNTQTKVAQYYIGGVLQGSVILTGPQINYLVFQGFQTGNLVNVRNVTLTQQPAP